MLNEVEIRNLCKEKLESLEYWLRRIIDETLSPIYTEYLNYEDLHGNRLIKREIVNSLNKRILDEPQRYSRPIDGLLLSDAIDIICNPNLYYKHFKDIFNYAYPEGKEVTRTFMNRILVTRNLLYHANPISYRQTEQLLCYSNDIIDSIKQYYTIKNLDNEYNVPLILKVTDSFGSVFFRNQLGIVHDGGISKDFTLDSKYFLRVGDILTLEVEVDSSFSVDEYKISWHSAKGFSHSVQNNKKVIIQITEKQVAKSFDVQCRITSNKNWHRMHLGADDFMLFNYKVLPPS